eukprot:TRINITY_DN2103_c0_g2_i1.p1 TRINITY_DN2103_c0_g2~~TRINITY_DN2103_c0_g2_i1.p1  ORF type:complete len:273 (+),score=46.12 TRINITY_DN2103_c0_g2_i1:60-821(+)
MAHVRLGANGTDGWAMFAKDLLCIGGCVAGCFIFDKLVATPMFKKEGTIDHSGRWFAVHAAANAAVTVASAKDTALCLASPSNCTAPDIECSMLPVYAIGAVHIYHCVGWSNLTLDDWFHHLVFGGTIVTTGLCFKGGHIVNALSFTLSGFPGGLDYVLLALVKLGVISHDVEKRWNARIMTWIRAPLTTILSYNLMSAFFSPGKQFDKPPKKSELFAATLVAILVYFNGNYYAQRVVGNAYRKDIHIQRVGS